MGPYIARTAEAVQTMAQHIRSANLGYRVTYDYRPAELTVRWSTDDGSAIRVDGEARFAPLSPRACLMTYRLALELPVSRAQIERHYDGHAASAVVGDFREHLRRYI